MCLFVGKKNLMSILFSKNYIERIDLLITSTNLKCIHRNFERLSSFKWNNLRNDHKKKNPMNVANMSRYRRKKPTFGYVPKKTTREKKKNSGGKGSIPIS